MGWFSKKKQEKKLKVNLSLPEIPSLPELPKIGEGFNELPKLPSYHSNSLGEKFSQTAIRDAVSREKLGDDEVFGADESFPQEEMMRKPRRRLTKEISETGQMKDLPEMKSQRFVKERVRETRPVFVRMDKFEEGLEAFEKTKKKMFEIERFLAEIKRIREKEENELQEWTNEVQTIKKQFEKIDRDLFSRI